MLFASSKCPEIQLHLPLMNLGSVPLIVRSFCVFDIVGAVPRICSLNSMLRFLEDYVDVERTSTEFCHHLGHKMNPCWPVHFLLVSAYDMDPI